MRTVLSSIVAVALSVAIQFLTIFPVSAGNEEPIIIGLDADMSGHSALSGEAIRRGILLAIDRVNANGGLLNRPVKLEVRDHRGNPARGIDNIEEFADTKNLVAVVGGIHTPVALAELEAIHRRKIVYLGPWAAGTPIVDNGHTPNFVFRVSVRDQHAGGFLVDAVRRRGFKKPGLLLWRTGWGRSNEKAIKTALDMAGMQLAGVEWFNSSQSSMQKQIKALSQKGADVLMLVANAADGLIAVRDISNQPAAMRLPIISHWGITGGDFYNDAGTDLPKVDLSFLQTFSFFKPPFPERSDALFAAYCSRFGPCQSPADVFAPVGTAHAFDLIRLLAIAVEKAGTTDRTQIRDALEKIERFDGLMRNYNPPFTATRHDALDASDFMMTRFNSAGAIVPVEQK